MIVHLLLPFLAAAPAPAPPDSAIPLPEVRVEGERGGAARRRLPTAFVTELRPETAGRAVGTLSELLGEAAGVRVQQYGGLGSFSTLSLRGAPPGQVSIYLDGAPLTSAAHGVVSLADLPATSVDHVEVYRGLTPLALGKPTPGGAVNIVTLAPHDQRQAKVARGSFGTWEGAATASQRLGPWSGLVHWGYQGSAGDFRFADDNGTPFNFADDSLSRRVNNRFDAMSVLASLSWEAPGGLRVGAREDYFHKAQGVPGLGAVPARDTDLRFRRSLTHLTVAREGEGWWPGLRLRGSLNRERSRFLDPRAELGAGRHRSDDYLDQDQLVAEAEWRALPLGAAVQAVGELREERAFLEDPADPYADPPPSGRATRAAAATLLWRPFGERLALLAGRRWDRERNHLRSSGVGGLLQANDVRRVLDTPQLGARLAPFPGLDLKANWTHARRAPDFLELFGNQGSVIGNPALRPEDAESWDAGLALHGARGALAATAEWAHFATRGRDLIVYQRNSQSSVRAQNVSRAEIRGQELSLQLSGPWGLGAAGAATWMSACDRGTVPAWYGKRLPGRPERYGYYRLTWKRRALRAALDLQEIGENYLDPANRQRVAERVLWGASLSAAPFGEGLRVVLEGKNLGDDRAADVGGFPLPGRSVFVSCETRLPPPPRP